MYINIRRSINSVFLLHKDIKVDKLLLQRQAYTDTATETTGSSQ